MRSRHLIHEPQAAHFVTSIIVAWLLVFTTAARCDLLIQSWLHCRENKGASLNNRNDFTRDSLERLGSEHACLRNKKTLVRC